MSELLILVPLIVAPLFGSFVTALVVRLPAGIDVVAARSHCPACDHVLAPRDLVPIVSWLALRGRCTHCRAPISPFYPLVELTALLVAVWSVLTVGGGLVWVSCGLGWTLLAIALIDWRHYLVPNSLVLLLAIAGLAVAARLDVEGVAGHAVAAAMGYAIIRIVGVVYERVRHRVGIGQGDAKLFAAAGAWVSLSGLPSVFLWACASALLVLVVQKFAGRTIAADTRVPFGAHLALGLWLVWLYGPIAVG